MVVRVRVRVHVCWLCFVCCRSLSGTASATVMLDRQTYRSKEFLTVRELRVTFYMRRTLTVNFNSNCGSGGGRGRGSKSTSRSKSRSRSRSGTDTVVNSAARFARSVGSG